MVLGWQLPRPAISGTSAIDGSGEDTQSDNAVSSPDNAVSSPDSNQHPKHTQRADKHQQYKEVSTVQVKGLEKDLQEGSQQVCLAELLQEATARPTATAELQSHIHSHHNTELSSEKELHETSVGIKQKNKVGAWRGKRLVE